MILSYINQAIDFQSKIMAGLYMIETSIMKELMLNNFFFAVLRKQASEIINTFKRVNS